MSERRRNPWFSMWVKPRETIREVTVSKSRISLIVLSFIYGWPMTLQLAQLTSLAQSLPIFLILLFSLLLAPFVGALCFALFSCFLWLGGKWLEGKSSFANLFRAVAWSNLTSIPSLLGWIWLIFTFRELIFSPDFAGLTLNQLDLFLILAFFIWQIVSLLWTVILVCIATSEVQGFSIGKAVISFAAAMLLATAATGVFLAFVENVVSWILR